MATATRVPGRKVNQGEVRIMATGDARLSTDLVLGDRVFVDLDIPARRITLRYVALLPNVPGTYKLRYSNAAARCPLISFSRIIAAFGMTRDKAVGTYAAYRKGSTVVIDLEKRI